MEPVRISDEEFTALFQVDSQGLLFVSPVIVDWKPLTERNIRLVIDLEGQVDHGVPTIPNNLIYVYFPFDDSVLPDLVKLHALGRLAAEMVRNQRAVLIHCAMGLNRSPLMAGVAMTYLGYSGIQALELLQSQRVGVLYNTNYAKYLQTLPPNPEAPGDRPNPPAGEKVVP